MDCISTKKTLSALADGPVGKPRLLEVTGLTEHQLDRALDRLVEQRSVMRVSDQTALTPVYAPMWFVVQPGGRPVERRRPMATPNQTIRNGWLARAWRFLTTAPEL